MTYNKKEIESVFHKMYDLSGVIYTRGDFGYWRVISEDRDDLVDKEYHGNLYCGGKLLTSLKGCPRTVSGNFSCSCNFLTSLEGAPKEVGGDFFCYANGKQFTVEDVKAVCNVKGKIYIKAEEVQNG